MRFFRVKTVFAIAVAAAASSTLLWLNSVEGSYLAAHEACAAPLSLADYQRAGVELSGERAEHVEALHNAYVSNPERYLAFQNCGLCPVCYDSLFQSELSPTAALASLN